MIFLERLKQEIEKIEIIDNITVDFFDREIEGQEVFIGILNLFLKKFVIYLYQLTREIDKLGMRLTEGGGNSEDANKLNLLLCKRRDLTCLFWLIIREEYKVGALNANTAMIIKKGFKIVKIIKYKRKDCCLKKIKTLNASDNYFSHTLH